MTEAESTAADLADGVEKGVHARVDAVAEIDPDDAHLSIWLEITATNKTDSDLPLDSYYLPAIRKTHSLKAHDEYGLLDATLGLRDRISFREGSSIPRGGSYTWEVSFECPGAFEMQGHSIAGPYPVTVQDEFCGAKVLIHEFVYKFVFCKPKPMRWWPFKTIDVIRVGGPDVKWKTNKKIGSAHLTACFALRHGESLRLLLATNYELSSIFMFVMTILLGAAFSELLQRLFSLVVS